MAPPALLGADGYGLACGGIGLVLERLSQLQDLRLFVAQDADTPASSSGTGA
jgi:hypothetical protein